MDLNWCVVCDRHIDNPSLTALYCSSACRKKERHHRRSSVAEIPQMGANRRSRDARRHSQVDLSTESLGCWDDSAADPALTHELKFPYTARAVLTTWSRSLRLSIKRGALQEQA